MSTMSIKRWTRSTEVALGALAIMSLAQVAFAQQRVPADWRHGTTVTGFFGAQSAASDTTAAGGAGVGWEVTPRIAIEGRGTWLRVNKETSDFAATLAAHMPLISGRAVAPFFNAGIGMYRATFDAGRQMPEFYSRRMANGLESGLHTFQDFLVLAGGGLNVFLNDHVAIRPDVNVMFVTTRKDARPVGVYGVQLVYHFDPHPIE